ncbi:fumarylacetoacetate hydrolase family protein [Streptomyces niveus]|uniref:fumarylacetoacetate hydrolase family protein n=1 Tax=Streptomyces niveus TaxID=193462 RepID=UPI003423B7F0
MTLSCAVDGEMLHDDRTRDLIFSVPELIAQISAVLALLPSDIVFTGTRPGWAWPEIRSAVSRREPPRSAGSARRPIG